MQRSALCRSRRELSNEYLLAKIGVDTAENEPLEVWAKIQFTIHFTPYPRACSAVPSRKRTLNPAPVAVRKVWICRIPCQPLYRRLSHCWSIPYTVTLIAATKSGPRRESSFGNCAGNYSRGKASQWAWKPRKRIENIVNNKNEIGAQRNAIMCSSIIHPIRRITNSKSANSPVQNSTMVNSYISQWWNLKFSLVRPTFDFTHLPIAEPYLQQRPFFLAG